MRWQWLLLAVSLVVAVTGAALYLPPAIDWYAVIRPATLTLLSGRSPYTVADFSYPAWALIPLMPLAILPEAVGRAVLLFVSLGTFAYSAHRLGAKPLTVLIFLLSPPVWHCLLNANIDWLILLGFALPPWAGLFLVIIKPQMGLVVALFWLVEAWRRNGWREVVRVFWPVTLALLITLALFGLWPLRLGPQVNYGWNASLWPSSLPIGLALSVAALRTRKLNYAMAASPCLSPYVLFHSWSAALIALVNAPAEMLAAVVGLWLWVILRAAQII